MHVSTVDICTRRMQYEFLPPYSPDYNPIELVFSYIKGVIQHQGDLVHMEMTGSDEVAVYLGIGMGDTMGWFGIHRTCTCQHCTHGPHRTHRYGAKPQCEPHYQFHQVAHCPRPHCVTSCDTCTLFANQTRAGYTPFTARFANLRFRDPDPTRG